MKCSKNLTTQLGLSLLFSSFAAVALAERDVPDEVTVASISYAGSGCPAGSVAKGLSSDKKAFTLLFDSYIAESGPRIALREKRKNCQLLVNLNFPSGWSFSIVDVDYRGYVSLDRGAKAIQKASYYFQGDGKTASLSTTLQGPLNSDYHIRDSLALDATVWSPCGAKRALIINSQIQADSIKASARALITVDSIDGQVEHIYGLQWKRCR